MDAVEFDGEHRLSLAGLMNIALRTVSRGQLLKSPSIRNDGVIALSTIISLSLRPLRPHVRKWGIVSLQDEHE